MMNYYFSTALAYDLRLLAPEIAAYGTESPGVGDGDGADYAGGNFKTPVGQRYHIAREITALWSEKDAGALARLWIAFAASHPDEFQENDSASPLRQLAESHIRAMPSEPRRESITAIMKEIPIAECFAETRQWLVGLGD